MKRVKLIKKVSKAAKAKGKTFELVRNVGNHDIWQCGNTKVPVPRHTEVVEYTAEGIMKALEDELGERWWK